MGLDISLRRENLVYSDAQDLHEADDGNLLRSVEEDGRSANMNAGSQQKSEFTGC